MPYKFFHTFFKISVIEKFFQEYHLSVKRSMSKLFAKVLVGKEVNKSVDFISAYEEEVCLIPCPVDCIMSDWSPWSDCSTSCETGSQMRYRHIKQMPSDGGRQCPSLDNAGKVNTLEC